MTKVIEFDDTFSPKELAEALVKAGYSRGCKLSGIIAGDYDDLDPDQEVSLSCAISEDDALELCSDEAVIEHAEELNEPNDDRFVEEGLRYVRSGEYSLARSMFSRVFAEADMMGVERALS